MRIVSKWMLYCMKDSCIYAHILMRNIWKITTIRAVRQAAHPILFSKIYDLIIS